MRVEQSTLLSACRGRLPVQLCKEYMTVMEGCQVKNQVEENVHASALPPLSNEIMKSVKSLYERFIKEKVHHYW